MVSGRVPRRRLSGLWLNYMDPPYQGVSGERDARYVAGLDLARFIDTLTELNQRRLSYIISFDGRLGDREYGPALPARLHLDRHELVAGRSSQATLLGRDEVTVESLYLSPALVTRLASITRTPEPSIDCATLFTEEPHETHAVAGVS